MVRVLRCIRVMGLIAVMLGMSAVLHAGPVTGQTTSCADYSSASAAQFALEINSSLASALDPDGNGIACDHEGGGQSGATGAGREPSDLQLPDIGDPAPSPSGQQDLPDVGAVDQQPVGTATGLELPTQPPLAPPTGQQDAQPLDGRIGGSRVAWEAIYGPSFNEADGGSPEVRLTESEPVPTSTMLATLWFNDQAFIVFLRADTSWSGAEAAPIIQEFLPTDITSIPEGYVLSDGSLLIPMFSEQLALAISAESMAEARIPGVPGDLYLLLITDGGERAVEIEIGIGNGDNVREDIDGSPTATTTPLALPTLPPDTTTTAAVPSAFLQETRAEVDRLLAEYDEFTAILAAGTFTDAEIDRMSEIIGGWVELDTSLPTAPPEHAGLAMQLQQVRTDLGSVALLIITGLASGGEDDTTIDESLALLDAAHTNLLELDQQLTALGV